MAWLSNKDLDARYFDFVQLCIDHPRLDCYSVGREPDPPPTADEKLQQNILYSALTDLFEGAYVQYHKRQ